MGAAGMEGLTTAVLLVKGLDGEVMLSNLPAGGETAGGADSTGGETAGGETAGGEAAGGAVAVAGGAWI